MTKFLSQLLDFFMGIFKKIVTFFFGDKKNKTQSLKEVKAEQVVPIARKPGLKCPECGTLITVTIQMLLTESSVYCTNCFLELKVNSEKSSESLNALKKLQNGLQQAEQIRKQGAPK